jgi:flagellar basal-body rod modification protein FlgD
MSTITTESDLFQTLGLARELQSEDSNEMALKDFMNLMVTELTHQDPFKPMDNTELATQISQFATVSGIDELNNSFSDLTSSLLSGQTLQAASLVGHDVLAPISTGYLSSGGTIEGMVGLYSAATDVTVQVYDSSGALVREIDLGTQKKGEVSFTWDGITDDGSYAAEGAYTITATSQQDGESVVPYTLIKAKVASVTLGGSGTEMALNLEGLGQIAFGDVAEIH